VMGGVVTEGNLERSSAVRRAVVAVLSHLLRLLAHEKQCVCLRLRPSLIPVRELLIC